MLDRLTNLLVLFTLVIALVVLAVSLYDAWNTTAAWEKEWVVKPGHSIPSAEEMQIAIQNAAAAHDYEAVRALENELEAHYEPSGKLLVRFSSSEVFNVAISVSLVLLFLIIPISINYVHHGKFKLWNRSQLKGSASN